MDRIRSGARALAFLQIWTYAYTYLHCTCNHPNRLSTMFQSARLTAHAQACFEILMQSSSSIDVLPCFGRFHSNSAHAAAHADLERIRKHDQPVKLQLCRSAARRDIAGLADARLRPQWLDWRSWRVQTLLGTLALAPPWPRCRHANAPVAPARACDVANRRAKSAIIAESGTISCKQSSMACTDCTLALTA